MSADVVIVDYGMGNLGAVVSMLHRLGVDARVSGEPDEFLRARRIILPGVGSFARGVANLRSRGLADVLSDRVLRGEVPILGICLGMQLLSRFSEEGEGAGLGWIAAETKRIPQDATGRLKVPHMGWNYVDVVGSNPLFAGLGDRPRFYFVHSFHLVCDSIGPVTGWSTHGVRFAAAVQAPPAISGVQFHPEKSHRFGMRLLANFVGVP